MDERHRQLDGPQRRRDSASRRRLARSTLGAVAFGVIGAVGACTFTAPSRAQVGAPPRDFTGEPVRIRSASGSTLAGWIAEGRPGRGGVLLLHGVGANRLQMLDRARFLHAAGHSVLLIDFQAHGESAGERITFGALESRDAAASLAYLRARVPGERVAVIGVSMGGAAALLGAGPLDADAFVLESVYPTIELATRDRLRAWLGPVGAPFASLVVRLLGRNTGVSPAELRPVERMKRLTVPVFVLAGTADRYTTIDESRSLFHRAPAPKEFWAVPGAGHVDLHAFARTEYERRVGAFLRRHLERATRLGGQATGDAPAAGAASGSRNGRRGDA